MGNCKKSPKTIIVGVLRIGLGPLCWQNCIILVVIANLMFSLHFFWNSEFKPQVSIKVRIRCILTFCGWNIESNIMNIEMYNTYKNIQYLIRNMSCFLRALQQSKFDTSSVNKIYNHRNLLGKFTRFYNLVGFREWRFFFQWLSMEFQNLYSQWQESKDSNIKPVTVNEV